MFLTNPLNFLYFNRNGREYDTYELREMKFYVPASVFAASSDSTTKTEQSSFTSCGCIMSANRDLNKG